MNQFFTLQCITIILCLVLNARAFLDGVTTNDEDCPPNQVLIDGKCQELHLCTAIIPVCPNGLKYPEGRCVPGYSFSKKKHFLSNVHIAEPSNPCPPGFKLLNGSCVSEESKCPRGFREENGACVQISHPPIVCPYGQAFIEGACRPVHEICPPGFKHYLGACIPAPAPTPQICPTGYIFKYGSCYPEITNTGCPLIYILAGGQCREAYTNPCHSGNIHSPCSMGPYPGPIVYKK